MARFAMSGASRCSCRRSLFVAPSLGKPVPTLPDEATDGAAQVHARRRTGSDLRQRPINVNEVHDFHGKMTMSEPLVLIPGLTCTAELYAPQWARLGVDRSVTVAEHRLDDSLAGIVERLLAAAPPRFALCGLSMGGYIAFEVMRRAPERVSRLALLDTSAKPATPETNALRTEMIALAEQGQFERVMAMMWLRLVAPARREDRALRDIVRRMASETGPEAFVRQQRAIMGRPDSRPELGGRRRTDAGAGWSRGHLDPGARGRGDRRCYSGCHAGHDPGLWPSGHAGISGHGDRGAGALAFGLRGWRNEPVSAAGGPDLAGSQARCAARSCSARSIRWRCCRSAAPWLPRRKS